MGTTALVVCLSAVSLTPVEDLVLDRVDLVEINHYYDDKGRHVLDQIIFYDWSQRHGRYQVRDWRMLKHETQIPRRDWEGQGFVAIWHDPIDGDVLRKVQAKSLRETWTQYDPEIVQRDSLPKDSRRKLTKLKRGPSMPR